MKLSISNLEQLSGVPVHTIRMWERRYNVLNPLRSAGNTRFYNDNHLKRLLNIVSLNQAGLKISQACALSDIEIDKYLEKDLSSTISSNIKFEYYISQLLKYGLVYNELKFHELLSLCISNYGITQSYEEVMFPLLQRLGLMWRRDHICPAQEHFISNIVRQKLMVAIDKISLVSQRKNTWLLFLPEDEAHDIPLMFANYLLRSNGFKVIYLGGSVPFESLKDAYANNNITNMLFFMVRQRPIKEANEYLGNLTEQFKNISFYIAGNFNVIDKLTLESNIKWFKSIADFKQTIQTNA